MTTLQDYISPQNNSFISKFYINNEAYQFSRSILSQLHKYSNSSTIHFYNFKRKDYVKRDMTSYQRIEAMFDGMVDLSKEDMISYNKSIRKLTKPLGININDL